MCDQSALTDSPPWYRQFWPWLLIALPASAVLGGIATIFIAVQSPNALVEDDYYKAGLAINQEKRRLAAARDRGLSGLLRSDGKRLVLVLNADDPIEEAVLSLRIIHSTRADLDRIVLLQRDAEGRYSAALPDLLPGPRYLRLQPADKSWEIRARFVVDGPFQAHLTFED